MNFKSSGVSSEGFSEEAEGHFDVSAEFTKMADEAIDGEEDEKDERAKLFERAPEMVAEVDELIQKVENKESLGVIKGKPKTLLEAIQPLAVLIKLFSGRYNLIKEEISGLKTEINDCLEEGEETVSEKDREVFRALLVRLSDYESRLTNEVESHLSSAKEKLSTFLKLPFEEIIREIEKGH